MAPNWKLESVSTYPWQESTFFYTQFHFEQCVAGVVLVDSVHRAVSEVHSTLAPISSTKLSWAQLCVLPWCPYPHAHAGSFQKWPCREDLESCGKNSCLWLNGHLSRFCKLQSTNFKPTHTFKKPTNICITNFKTVSPPKDSHVSTTYLLFDISKLEKQSEDMEVTC